MGIRWRGMAKSKNVEDRRGMVTVKKKKVTLKSTPSTTVPAKKKKPTGLNGPVSSTTKTVRVSKAAGTRVDGTLKKGHRYVKGGGIVKVTSK